MRVPPALVFAGRPATAAAALAGALPPPVARTEPETLPAKLALPAVLTAAPPGRCLSTRLTLGTLGPAAAARGPDCLAGAGRLVLLPCRARSPGGCLTPSAADAAGGNAELCLAPATDAVASFVSAAGCLAVPLLDTASAGRGMRDPRLEDCAAAPAPAQMSWIADCTLLCAQ